MISAPIVATTIWNSSLVGLDLIPGETVEGCSLVITADNELIYWNKRGIGITKLLEMVTRKLICEKYLSISDM